ncbi:hypothetical protein KY332_00730 [Candidatus Woesearchaeota archaeon]|nr:hypothetical protein [Candidatus Woesearchaeota archaeon]
MKVQACPKCKSVNIYYEAAGTLDKRGKWVCKDCGYIGPLILEKEWKK